MGSIGEQKLSKTTSSFSQENGVTLVKYFFGTQIWEVELSTRYPHRETPFLLRKIKKNAPPRIPMRDVSDIAHLAERK